MREELPPNSKRHIADVDLRQRAGCYIDAKSSDLRTGSVLIRPLHRVGEFRAGKNRYAVEPFWDKHVVHANAQRARRRVTHQCGETRVHGAVSLIALRWPVVADVNPMLRV